MQETAVQKPDSAMQPEHWYDALPRPAYASLERVPVTEDWFGVYRIQPDLYAIYEPGHFQEVISYLITGSEKALLVDTGLGMGNIRKVVEELTSLPVIVMNTHTHFDHIGGNALFDTVYAPDHPEARRRLSAGATAAELAAEVTEGSNARPWPEGFDPAHYTIAPCAFTPAPEGTVFDLGGWKLRVIDTPGHSPDSIMLAEDDRKLLFTGDTFYPAALYVALASDRPVPELLKIYQGTMALLAKEFSGYTLICSHNEPVRGGEMLGKTADALAEILAGKEPDEIGNAGLRRYEFDGFAVITR